MDQGGFLSTDKRAHLEALVRRPTERHGIARRANAVLLLDDGLRCKELARVLYLDDDTVRRWRDRFRQEGARALAVFGWKARVMPAQKAELAATLDTGFFPTTAAVIGHIRQAFGASFSKAGMIRSCTGWAPSGRGPRGCRRGLRAADDRPPG